MTSSFIAVAMNSRDQYKIIGLHKISHFKNNLVEMFAWKKQYKCIKVAETMQYLGLTKQKINISIYSKLLNFKPRPNFISQPVTQPAVRPGSARCRPPDLYRLCTVMSDLRIFRSAEDSSPAQSSFLLTITDLPSISFFLLKRHKVY